MDEIDAVPRPRRQRPKDSFQHELQSKLKQRKSLGLSAGISDTDEDNFDTELPDYKSLHAGRSNSANKRSEPSSSLRGGLGTTTLGARDLTQLLGNTSRGRYDDEDEEVVAANYGKASAGGRTWQSSGGFKTPSPTQGDARLSTRTPTYGSPKDQTGKLDSLFGRSSQGRESPGTSKSPHSGLSKEDIIFGRKTPSSDGKKSPADGSRLPGMGGSGDKWQPPNFRSVSPSSSVEHSRGSRGVTPVDSALGTISETPREKANRFHKGQGQNTEASPRQSYGQAPKPQTRNIKGDRKTPPLINDRKTPPIIGERRTSPLADRGMKSPMLRNERGESENQMKRTTPTLDLFGKSRSAANQDLGSYIASAENEEKILKTKEVKQERQLGYSRGKTAASGKTPGLTGQPGIRRIGAASPGSANDRIKSPLGRKTPTQARDDRSRSPEKERQEPQNKQASLLDFLMEDSGANKPKPKERERFGRDLGEKTDGYLSSNRKTTGHVGFQRRKSQELSREDTGILGQPEEMFRTAAPAPPPQEQNAEDTSSICEEIPPDPNRKMKQEQQRAAKSGKQTTERALADSAIDTIAEAQTMTYIEPAKKMRPFTASAKVQHRPKPRYQTLPGQTQTLAERQFNSTGDIRDAIYEEWYHERIKDARRKKKEEEQKTKKEEEDKKKAEKEKRLEADASYRAWMDKKKEVILTEKEKKDAEERAKKEKERQDAEEKRLESIKSFQHWKQEKDAMIKRELYKKAKKKEEEEETKKYEERQKQKERETAFQGWKNKKEKVIHKQISEKKYMEKTKKQREDEEKEELRRKEEEAMERYEGWLARKERQIKQEKRKTKLRREDDFKPAFRPASSTIPFGH